MSTTAVATRQKSADVALVPEADMEAILQLDRTAKAASQALIQAELERNDMAKGLIMARAMKRLQQLLTPAVMADVMELQGSKLGFRTDMDSKGGYKDHNVVRDVMIQALIRGLRPTGNEINIIASNLYVTKEGFERLLKEFPGLTDLAIEVGVPVTHGTDGALVPCRASWSIGGKQDLIVCEKGQDADYRIAVRVNSGMGVDAIQGKAKSKLYRRVYERLTGTAIMSEGDVGDPIDTTATTLSDKPAPNDPSASNRS